MTTPDRVHRTLLMRKQQEAMFLVNEALNRHTGKEDCDKAVRDLALDIKNALMLHEDEPVYLGV